MDFSVSTIVLEFVVILLLIVMWHLSTRRPPGSPCGPGFAVPCLGHLCRMKKDPRQLFRKWRQKYGNIFSFYVGHQMVVVLNEFSVIKEAFVTMSDVFSHRPHINGTNRNPASKDYSMNNCYGIAMNSGLVWKDLRKAVVEVLKQLVRENNAVEEKVHEELTYMLKYLENKIKDPAFTVNVSELAANTMLNLSCSMILGIRFSYNDSLFRHIQRFFDLTFRQLTTEQNLPKVLVEMMVASAETTATALGWIILCLIRFPVVQTTCYNCLQKVVGLSRYPTANDRTELVYIDAVILESLRISNMSPFLIPHATSRDVTFRGHVIPKGSQVVPNVESVVNDAKLWKDPDVFRPERFISETGKLIRPEKLLTFGIGPRACPGEYIGRLSLFLYTSCIVQMFRIEPEISALFPTMNGVMRMSYCPKPFNAKFILRHT